MTIKLKLSKNNDNYETPKCAWEIILKYIDNSKILWLPFYCNGLAKQYVEELGFTCFHQNKDFFSYEPDNYDYVIDNPPYSIKKEVLQKLITNNKPFALFMPIDTLERKYIRELLDTNKLQIIIPKERIHCITQDKQNHIAPYKTCWFCYNMNLLDGKQLIFE